jgi:hypothetical protein
LFIWASSGQINLVAMELDEIFMPDDRDPPLPGAWDDAFEM